MKRYEKLLMMFVLIGIMEISFGATIICDYQFAVHNDGITPVSDGEVMGTGFNTWSLAYDSSGNNSDAATWCDGTPYIAPTYAAYDTAGLGSSYDGFAMRVPGNLMVFNRGNNGNGFTTWGRFNLSDAGANQTLFSRGFEYQVYLDAEGDLGLTIDIGHTYSNIVSAADLGVGSDTWVDIGFSFDGVGADGINDTWNLYVNGVSVASDAVDSHLQNTGVDWPEQREWIGSHRFGSAPFVGLIDRYIYMDGAATQEEIQMLSVPEPGTLVLLGLGCLAIRKMRKVRI